MANTSKKRLLMLMEYLYQKTDDVYPASTTDIFEYLDEFGMKPDRKTLNSDIELLKENGMDIETLPGNPVKYFVANRNFELPEVKLLVDAVDSSRFITAKKSKILCNKLIKLLVSDHQAETISRHLYTSGRMKPNNESIYILVDELFEAINTNKLVTFAYAEYILKDDQIKKQYGKKHELSPYALLWNEDHYYCVGFSAAHEQVATFRVDRMKQIKLTNAPAVPKPKSFDVKDYYTQVFDMFSGESEQVELRCHNSHMKSVYDRFGEKCVVRSDGADHFIVQAKVSVSPTFFAWVFQFGGEIKIISPTQTANAYREMCMK
jgi:predicted DNA-binding transcriptional regulator YafY